MAASPFAAAHVTRVLPAGTRGVSVETDLHWHAEPGQFVMLWLPRVDEKPFSLVDCDPVTLTIVNVGPFTALMQGVRPGERVFLRGPFGRGFRISGQRPLIIGGGCGAAALTLLCRRLRERGVAATVALGGRTVEEVLLAERFRVWGAEVLLSTDDGSAGEHGLVTDLAGRLLATASYDQVYACGPSAMLERVADLCRRHRVPGQVSREAYMRCGMGICGSCACEDGSLVCRDGPVFVVGGVSQCQQ
ncbi:MAG: dihydroorotate dehydrogenase electron transfer subunit [Anaerolineae bacterium]